MFVLYFLTICNLINNTLEISAKISADIFISIHTSAREVTLRQKMPIHVQPISIHTSAREVTEADEEDSDDWGISIHTSAREVTARMLSIFLLCTFQSTLP